MRLVRWSVDHPAAVLALYAGLIALSVLALLFRIPVRLTPAIEPTQISVTLQAEGLSAEAVEARVTTPVERALGGVGSVRYLRSMSMHGMSVVTLEFPYRHDMRRAETEVSAVLEAVDLPARPRVARLDPLDHPVLRLGVRSSGHSPQALQDLLDTTVTARLRQVPGVDSVYTFGGPSRQVHVGVDRERLQAAGLSLGEVWRAVEAAVGERPGGTLHDVASPTSVVEFGSLSPEDLEALVIGGRVPLREIARIDARDHADAPRYRCNGRAAIELNVVQQPDASSPRTIAGVRTALDRLSEEYPGLDFEVAYDNAHFVEIVAGNVWAELALAVALTGGVLFLFLGDWKGTLIALATVPTSLACAVVLFVPLGLCFDSSTLIGLLLAIGRLVDDTIIDLHAVQRHLALGKDARSAAIDGCTEVRRAVIAATVVICLAMLPLTFAGGLTQDMFTGLVWPFLLALAASLFVALTLTPLLASWAWRGAAPPSFVRFEGLEGRYRSLLRRALDHRGVVLAGAFAVCYLAWTAFPLVGSEMMPLADTGQLYCVMEARPGASTEETSRLAAGLEAILQRQPEVLRISTEIGAPHGAGLPTGYGGRGPNSAVLLVTLSDKDQRSRTIWDIADGVRAEARRTLPHLRRLTLKEMGSDVMASAMAPIELVIHGPDLARLDWLAERTREIAEGMPGLEQPATAWSLGQPGWRVVGVSDAEAAAEVHLALEGRTAGGVTVSLRDGQRRTSQDLEELLREIAVLERTVVPDVIEHDGLRRSNSVMASYRNGGPGSMQLGMDLLMASRMRLPYPAGYDIEQRGDMVQMMDSFERLLWGLGVALVLMYLALVVQFGSATTPLAILAAIPLELPGVVLGLLLAHQTFSTVSLLGIVVLSGMDVTASILLLDAVLARKARGASTAEALLEGAPTRLRPVLMTVAVTLAVMLPLAFFPRTGMDAYAPLATVVVGGLAMSTLLTLGIVPVLFSLLDRRGEGPSPRASWWRTKP